MTQEPATIGTNFQTLKNMRYTDTHIKSVQGMTKINSTALSTYLKVRNAYHFKKFQPAESHLLVQAYNTGLTASQILDNTTAIPSTGDYSATSVFTDSTGAGRGYFSAAPNGQLAYANGVDCCLWGGNEMECAAFITSTAAVTDTGNPTNPKDRTDEMKNTKTDADNIAVIGGGIDSYTVLMLHCDGADDSTTFTDSSSSAHTVTAVGNAKLDTTYKKFGESSGIFDGTGDYLTVPDHANWDFGTGDFTIDFWWRPSAVSVTNPFCGQYTDNNNTWSFGYNSLNTFYFTGVDSSTIIALYASGTVALSAGTWYHIELVRNGASVYLFLNGVSQTFTAGAAISTNSMPDIAEVLEIGARRNHTEVLNGHLDEFRISKGIARHTSNFTPRSVPYASSANTFLVGSPRPLKGIKAYVSNSNAIASSLTGSCWGNGTWNTLTLTDNTDTGASLAQTGTVTFDSTVAYAKPKFMCGYYLYWYQFTLSAGEAELYKITLDAPFQNIVDLWDNVFRDVVAAFVRKWTGLTDVTAKILRDDYDADVDTTYGDLSVLDGFSEPNNCIEVGFHEKISGLFLKIPEPNGNATVMGIDYYSGSGYSSVGTITDGTASGGKSLNNSGVVTWDNANINDETKTDSVQRGSGFWRADNYVTEPLYFYRIRFTNMLDAIVRLDYIGGIVASETINYFKFTIFAQGRIFLCCDMSGAKNKAIVSAKYMPQVFNGEDTADLYFGEDGELTCGVELFSQYGGNLYSMVLVFKDNETWVIAGQDIDQWNDNIFAISTIIGCPAPQTLRTINLVSDNNTGINRSLAIWQGANGVYMSDGRAPLPIYGDIEAYFDPNDARCIKASMVGDSEAWIDQTKQEYHLKIASGTSATSLNTELVYDVKRNKWFLIDRGTGNNLQCGVSVTDTYGNNYTYGFLDTGYTERLEYGNDFDGVDITSNFKTGDFTLMDSLAHETRLSDVKLIEVAKTTTTNSATFTHYANTSTSGTAKTMLPTNSGKRVAFPYFDEKLNGDPFHSIDISMVTDNETIGFEPIAIVVGFHATHQD
ncbi:MAG: LamG domain-containing protein [Porphyromonadaceae bacterium]|nr:LamG domain-containing protein [Porphyromonadaceae bacterium]